MSKKLTKSLLAACTMLGVGVISLTSVTYAWFQGGDKAAVEDFNANVVTADGLLVSWDAKTWGSELKFNSEEYMGVKSNTQLFKTQLKEGSETETEVVASDFRYGVYSTAASTLKDGALSFYSAELSADGKQIKSSAVTFAEGNLNGTAGGIVKFDMYLNVVEDTLAEITNPTFALASGEVNVTMAARMAVINQGVVDSSVQSASTDVLDLKTSNAASMFIYEPNADKHTSEGVADKIDANDDGIYEYYGLIGASGETLFDRKSAVEGYSEIVTTVTSGTIGVELKAGFNKVTFYVWVEGQDADCTNTLQDSTLALSFGLTKGVSTLDTKAVSPTTSA